MIEHSQKIIHSGLTHQQAAMMLEQEGFNELPLQKKQSAFSIFLSVMKEPMLLILALAGTIYIFMGEPQDALMLLTFIFFVIGITFYQEHKTEKTLDALRSLSSPRALVIRNGKQKMIAGREVVSGDIVLIHEGDRVPADAVILDCENLYVDESLLTGESIAVHKIPGDKETPLQRPGDESSTFVYSGSMVISGRGLALVRSTGIRTEMGRIGKSLGSIRDEDTLLHKETSMIVRRMGLFGLLVCISVVAIYVATRGDLMEGFLAGLTLSMSMLPEEFPVVLVIFLTLGAWRISKKQVLTRRAAAIETLGAATVLCADKTGTLTMNRMELETLHAEGKSFEIRNGGTTSLPERFRDLLKTGLLSSQQDPFDPIEKELIRKCRKYLPGQDECLSGLSMVKEYSLSKELAALSHVWQDTDGTYLIASKGSPEAVLDLCHITGKDRDRLLRVVNGMSEKGLRVLGAARAIFSGSKLPESQRAFEFRFSGFFGFIDPPRATAAAAVRDVYSAGMRVIMITGDYPGTAQFIARRVGIRNPEIFLTGRDIETLDDQELSKAIKETNIFARVIPEQKLRIVNALKANDEIVAMTGDGVNDAPALKAAHIGIAMSERGTDVAREASALVLLNDDFSSIVAAVRLGRRIYSNLKKAMNYILAVHIPIAGISVIPLAFGLPAVLLPAHIAFLELIIDPACSTVFESKKESSRIMKRPPRDIHASVFSRRSVLISLLQGLGILLTTLLTFLYAVMNGRSHEEIRSFAFVGLVLSNLILIVVNLSWRDNIFKILLSGNKVLYLVIAGALTCLLAVLYIPFFSGVFRLAPLGLKEFLLVSAASLAGLIWFEALKFFKPGFGHN